jgi:hypothetical protein
MSPFTLRKADLSPSTLAAISFANRFLPSSRTLSASSRRLLSSISSGLSCVGPLNKKLRRTGLLANGPLIKRVRYARRVSLFFSRESLAARVVGEDGSQD